MWGTQWRKKLLTNVASAGKPFTATERLRRSVAENRWPLWMDRTPVCSRLQPSTLGQTAVTILAMMAGRVRGAAVDTSAISQALDPERVSPFLWIGVAI